jgi:hypothetical protein
MLKNHYEVTMIRKLQKTEGGRWLGSDRFVILIEAKMMTVVICSLGFLRSFHCHVIQMEFCDNWVKLGFGSRLAIASTWFYKF